MRFGEFSRAPLRLLRLEVRGSSVECDWAARPPDAWDASLLRPVRDRNESLQALSDAMTMRDLLFDALPEVETAVLRAFRQSPPESPELIILGTVNKEAPYVLRVDSIVMRAKLYGLCFSLEDTSLRRLNLEQPISELIT
jgi:hypothetical protein